MAPIALVLVERATARPCIEKRCRSSAHARDPRAQHVLDRRRPGFHVPPGQSPDPRRHRAAPPGTGRAPRRSPRLLDAPPKSSPSQAKANLPWPRPSFSLRSSLRPAAIG